MKNFVQKIPSDVCLSCDICCRFKSKHSEWRPKVCDEERARFFENNLSGNFLKAIQDDEQCRCMYFNKKDQTCTVYSVRPMECRVYPFVVIQKEGKTYLALHSVCPYIQKNKDNPEFLEWIEDAKQYFSLPEIKKIVKNNPHLAGDYSAFDEEIEEIMILEN